MKKENRKILADAVLQELRRKHPLVPEYALPRKSIGTNTANGVTKAILTWLQLKGHYASRIQSQGQYHSTLGRWTKGTVKRGIGDCMAIIDGRTIMIEVKIGKDKLSIHQKKTKCEVEASGGVYLVVHSFDDFIEWYEKR